MEIQFNILRERNLSLIARNYNFLKNAQIKKYSFKKKQITEETFKFETFNYNI
jgi:hypothetical protein